MLYVSRGEDIKNYVAWLKLLLYPCMQELPGQVIVERMLMTKAMVAPVGG